MPAAEGAVESLLLAVDARRAVAVDAVARIDHALRLDGFAHRQGLKTEDLQHLMLVLLLQWLLSVLFASPCVSSDLFTVKA